MISTKLAKSLSENSQYSYDACLYIIKTYTHILISVILILIIAILLGVGKLASIIMFSAMILRSASGGGHSKSKIICTVISLIIPIGGAYLIDYSNINNQLMVGLSFLSTIIGLLIIIRYAPADTVQKPIISEKFRKILKVRAISFLIIAQLMVLVLFFINFIFAKEVSLAIYIGTCWQLFTITPLGYSLFRIMDTIFASEG